MLSFRCIAPYALLCLVSGLAAAQPAEIKSLEYGDGKLTALISYLGYEDDEFHVNVRTEDALQVGTIERVADKSHSDQTGRKMSKEERRKFNKSLEQARRDARDRAQNSEAVTKKIVIGWQPRKGQPVTFFLENDRDLPFEIALEDEPEVALEPESAVRVPQRLAGHSGGGSGM